MLRQMKLMNNRSTFFNPAWFLWEERPVPLRQRVGDFSPLHCISMLSAALVYTEVCKMGGGEEDNEGREERGGG